MILVPSPGEPANRPRDAVLVLAEYRTPQPECTESSKRFHPSVFASVSQFFTQGMSCDLSASPEADGPQQSAEARI
jgi:hypothetical protein